MIKFRPMTAQNAGRFGGIDPAWPAPVLTGLALRPAFMGVMAEAGKHPAGFIIGWLVDHQVEIIQISVAADYRRRGIGTALINRVLDNHAPRSCYLEVRADNLAAQQFYGSLGFQDEGLRKGYYRRNDNEGDNGGNSPAGDRVDAVLMRLDTGFGES